MADNSVVLPVSPGVGTDAPKSAALFEVSWEVCNKVGGIYTVVSTKALEASKRFGENYFLLGPELGNNHGFIETNENDPENRQWDIFRHVATIRNLKCRFGHWDIPGRPKVILVDWRGRYNQNQLLYDLWRDFGVDSLTGGYDYVEPVMFSYACGEVISAFSKVLTTDTEDFLPAVAHFHEWMCGAGLLYIKRNEPTISTVFTTHATVLGRSLAGSGRDIYAEIDKINPTQEARNCNITAKHSMETISAREADVFTTVSDITANEAAAFLSRRPDIVTPNGLSLDTIPDYTVDRTLPNERKAKIFEKASQILHRTLPANTVLLLISGRYEYHNKGIDVFLDALANLNRTYDASKRRILALCAVMGGHNGIDPSAFEGSMPKLTAHHVYDSAHDPILCNCMRLGLDNREESAVSVIFDPAQLDGNDGFLNMTYDEVLSACDCAAFPSWYEPWGYTPQEAAANAVPTATSDYAGYGLWLKGQKDGDLRGTAVVERARATYSDSVQRLSDLLARCASLSEEEMTELRKAARTVATLTDWKIFYKMYDAAYDLAAHNAKVRLDTRPVTAIDNDEDFSRTLNGTPSSTPLLHGFTSTILMPKELERLSELANNMWWTWHPEFSDLFSVINPEQWERVGHNAIAQLEKTDRSRFDELARNSVYVSIYRRAIAAFDADMNASFDDSVPELTPQSPIAYFSTEYGIHESLPIYSGGLGVLSGDHLKSASDLKLPLVAVGLLYKCGYFQQQINAEGHQVALYPENNFRLLPLKRVKDEKTGDHLYISVDLPGRTLYARVWQVSVGRVPLYLLDTDTPKNTEEDRHLTDRLYVADRDARIRQEILLGIGGPRVMSALGLHPHVYHMNEGHSAFMILERIGHLCQTRGLTFEAAREVVRGDSVFTTHTPVDAGNEKFSSELMHRYFDSWCDRLKLSWKDLMKLGSRETSSRSGSAPDFEMTLLALNHSVRSNGVSKLHGGVSRAMWRFNWNGVPIEEIPIGSITNGVHLGSIVGRPMAKLFDLTMGEEWRFLPADAPEWKNVESIPDETLWQVKQAQKKALLDLLAATSPKEYRQASLSWKQMPLVIGFARRFAPYKRATLCMADMQRLTRILSDSERPVIMVFSGKAHPADSAGNDLIKQVVTASRGELNGKIFFIPNYNLDIARVMVGGCDVWLNTPRRPYEASGTSGQKAAANGTLNFSVSDGWWCEGDNGKNGWTIGPRVKTIHDTQNVQSDYSDAESLYLLLESEIAPMFFDRGSDGLPHDWIERMKNSIMTLAPEYNSARMVRQYFEKCYRVAAARHVQQRAELRLAPRRLSDWKESVGTRFAGLRIDQIKIDGLQRNAVPCTTPLSVTAWVVPGSMKLDEFQIQFVAGLSNEQDFLEKPNVVVLKYDSADDLGRLVFKGTYTPEHNGHYLYGVRALPYSPDLDNLLETRLIQWA